MDLNNFIKKYLKYKKKYYLIKNLKGGGIIFEGDIKDIPDEQDCPICYTKLKDNQFNKSEKIYIPDCSIEEPLDKAHLFHYNCFLELNRPDSSGLYRCSLCRKSDNILVLDGYLSEYQKITEKIRILQELEYDPIILVEVKNQEKYQYLFDDPEIILAVIHFNRGYFKYASERLKNDLRFIFQVLSINPFVYEYIKEDFKTDKNILLTTLRRANELNKYINVEIPPVPPQFSLEDVKEVMPEYHRNLSYKQN